MGIRIEMSNALLVIFDPRLSVTPAEFPLTDYTIMKFGITKIYLLNFGKKLTFFLPY